jgi:hypothetical protein
MLIKIGYNIALKFAFPTVVIHLLQVHPSAGPISLNLNVLRPIRIFRWKNITTDSVTIAGAFMPLLVLSDFSAKQSSATAGSSMRTHPTQ